MSVNRIYVQNNCYFFVQSVTCAGEAHLLIYDYRGKRPSGETGGVDLAKGGNHGWI